MSAYSIPGDFTFLGIVTFAGGVSISDIEALTLNLNATLAPSTTNIGSDTAGVNVYIRGDDLQIEALGNMRFDSAFGGSGNCSIANSNSTHLQLANGACQVDLTCTSFFHSGTGVFAVNGASLSLQTLSSVVFSADNSQNVAVSGSTITVGNAVSCTLLTLGFDGATVISNTCSEFNVVATQMGAGIGVVNIAGTLAVNISGATTNIGDDNNVTALTLGQFTSAVTNLNGLSVTVTSASTMDLIAPGNVNLSSTAGTLKLGNNFNPCNIYSSGMDIYAQGGTITVNADTQIIIGGALSNAIALGDASVVPQVLAFNSPRTFVNSPSFLFQTSVVDLSGQATASSSGLHNVMMNLAGHLVVSTIVNPSQPFWVMGGNSSGLPIFGVTTPGTGITLRSGSGTFLNIIGASGNMTLQNLTAGTTAITSVGSMSISSAASIALASGTTPVLNIGNAACVTTIDATTLNLANYANAAAGLGVYANSLLGANKAYVVIDTVTGAISSITPS